MIKKIILIGFRTFNTTTENRILKSIEWSDLDHIHNLSDFDMVIINLLSIKEEVDQFNWFHFDALLNEKAAKDILWPDGTIIIIGDPRFIMKRINRTGHELPKKYFLDWTCLRFSWDERPGNNIHPGDSQGNNAINKYKKYLTKWDYSLIDWSLNIDSFRIAYPNIERNKVDLRMNSFLKTRYLRDIIFSLRKILIHISPPHPEGSILFLPEINLSVDETVYLVLKEFCQIEETIPEPEWAKNIIAPGQKEIDEEIEVLEKRMESCGKEIDKKEEERSNKRKYIRLFYDTGYSFEQVVLDVLEELGAEIEKPKNKEDEDGWLTYGLDGEELKGVLEIKSTKNSQFGESGIKQLAAWRDKGIRERQLKYKGIFIGSNDIENSELEARNYPFSDSWEKAAKLHEFVAIRAQDLYKLYCLKCEGKLDTDKLWAYIFSTHGVFDLFSFLGEVEEAIQV